MTILRKAAAVAILISMTAPAHAYLDGATASIALQAIIGFFAAWGLLFFRFLHVYIFSLISASFLIIS